MRRGGVEMRKSSLAVGPDFVVERGLFQNMVAQRTSAKCGLIHFSGRCDGIPGGGVWGRVGKAPWREIGAAAKGRFSGCFEDVPVGGPYDFTLSLRRGVEPQESKNISNVFVGDVWIMAGQSNMVGDGLLSEGIKADDGVMCFYMDDTWGKAEEPLHSPSIAVDIVHHQLNGRSGPVGLRKEVDRKRLTGAGCGIAFANEMRKALDVPIGLIACAHGATSMRQWLPGQAGEEGETLYSAMIRRVMKNSGTAAGVIWYQGESDATYEGGVHYYERMVALIKALRKDLAKPDLPFVIAQLSRVHTTENHFTSYLWTLIRESQRLLSERLEHVSTVGSLDLDMKDPIHVGAKGLSKIGYRMGKAAARHFTTIKKHSSVASDGPTIKSARFKKDVLGEYVEVTCRGVRGRLAAQEELRGFSLQGEFGWQLPIWKTVVEPSGNVVRLYFCNDNPVAERFFLYYGYGMAPHCNIADSEGLALLGFGPYPLGVKQAYTKPRGQI